MIKYIMEKGGKFYLKRWDLFTTKIWDSNKDYWWYLYPEHGTPFNSKEELRAAYNSRKSKFRGLL